MFWAAEHYNKFIYVKRLRPDERETIATGHGERVWSSYLNMVLCFQLLKRVIHKYLFHPQRLLIFAISHFHTKTRGPSSHFSSIGRLILDNCIDTHTPVSHRHSSPLQVRINTYEESTLESLSNMLLSSLQLKNFVFCVQTLKVHKIKKQLLGFFPCFHGYFLSRTYTTPICARKLINTLSSDVSKAALYLAGNLVMFRATLLVFCWDLKFSLRVLFPPVSSFAII